jgi:hypothetical protein
MGQFMTISIVKEFSIPKKDAVHYLVTLASITTKLKQLWGLDTELYQLSETEGSWRFSLKPDLLQTELYDFLTTFYPHYYIERPKVYGIVLEDMKASLDVWEFIKEYSEEPFQLDKYAGNLGLHFEDIDFRPYIPVYLNECIIIALAGKIIIETHNTMCGFMSRMIQSKFSDYKLASSLIVNITG